MCIDFYVEEVRNSIKAIHTEYTTTVQTMESNQTFLDRYLEEVDVNSLQESVLEGRITQYNRLSEPLESLDNP